MILSEFERQSILLSSRTVFIFSIQTASTGPSQINHWWSAFSHYIWNTMTHQLNIPVDSLISISVIIQFHFNHNKIKFNRVYRITIRRLCEKARQDFSRIHDTVQHTGYVLHMFSSLSGMDDFDIAAALILYANII